MGWVFAAVVLIASNIHQCALTFVFEVGFSFGDLLPIIVLASFLALEIMRDYGREFGAAEFIVALVPLAAASCAVLSGSFLETAAFRLGALWYPPVALGLAALLIFIIGLRNRWHGLLYVALAYVLAVVLTAGITPGDPRAFNSLAFYCTLALALFVIGVVRRKVGFMITAVFILSFCGGFTRPVAALADGNDLSLMGIVGLAASLGITVVYLVFPRKLPKWLAGAASVVLAASAIVLLRSLEGLLYPMLGSLAIAITGGVVLLRTRDIFVVIASCVPLARGIYIATTDVIGWLYVAVSFVLLAVGTSVSLRKGRMRRDANAGASQGNARTLLLTFGIIFLGGIL